MTTERIPDSLRIDARYERLYQIARKAAVDEIGGPRAFALMGSTICAALIRSQALILITLQDETSDPARMTTFAQYVGERVADEINAETI